MSNIILNSNTTIMCTYSMCLWVDTGSQVENWDTLDILEFFPPTFIDLSSRFRSILKYENLDLKIRDFQTSDFDFCHSQIQKLGS